MLFPLAWIVGGEQLGEKQAEQNSNEDSAAETWK